MSWDFNEWDLNDLTDEEQQAFWSAVGRPGDGDYTNEEMAAYNKAVAINAPETQEGHGKAGFGQEVRDFQRQAFMYSFQDADEQRQLWAQREVRDGGIVDEQGTWIAGDWEDGLFYPADGQSPCLGASPGTVDKNGNPIPT